MLVAVNHEYISPEDCICLLSYNIKISALALMRLMCGVYVAFISSADFALWLTRLVRNRLIGCLSDPDAELKSAHTLAVFA